MQPDQQLNSEQIMDIITKWVTDPVGMRRKILESQGVAPPPSMAIQLMAQATNERACALAWGRGEKIVCIGPTIKCPVCNSRDMGPAYEIVKAQNPEFFVWSESIWYGKPTGWVCMVCETPTVGIDDPQFEAGQRVKPS